MLYEFSCTSAQYEIQTNHGKFEFGHKDIDPDHLNSWKWYELFLVIQVTIWQIVMLSISSKACEQYIDQVPYRYYCYCGKVRDPEYDPWMKPHTCGNLCEKKLPCGHLCNDLCHPGLFFFPLLIPRSLPLLCAYEHRIVLLWPPLLSPALRLSFLLLQRTLWQTSFLWFSLLQRALSRWYLMVGL